MMGWTVRECSSIPKPGRVNEDLVLVSEHFVGLFDGCTAKHPVRLAGETPGAFASRVAASAFATLDPDATCDDAVDHATAVMAGELERAGMGARDVEPPATSLVVMSLRRQEVWAVGDGYVRIDDEPVRLGGPPSDQVVSRMRDLYQSLLLARGADPAVLAETDPAHELVMPVLSLQWHVRNDATSRWGYGSIDGSVVPPQFRRTFDVSGAGSVVLTTDGYLSPAATLALAEAELAALADADPLMLSGPGTRARPSADSPAFDDRSYVRLGRAG